MYKITPKLHESCFLGSYIFPYNKVLRLIIVWESQTEIIYKYEKIVSDWVFNRSWMISGAAYAAEPQKVEESLTSPLSSYSIRRAKPKSVNRTLKKFWSFIFGKTKEYGIFYIHRSILSMTLLSVGT